jgi:hypothetical protein
MLLNSIGSDKETAGQPVQSPQMDSLLADATAYLVEAYEAIDELSRTSSVLSGSPAFLGACRCLCATVVAFDEFSQLIWNEAEALPHSEKRVRSLSDCHPDLTTRRRDDISEQFLAESDDSRGPVRRDNPGLAVVRSDMTGTADSATSVVLADSLEDRIKNPPQLRTGDDGRLGCGVHHPGERGENREIPSRLTHLASLSRALEELP